MKKLNLKNRRANIQVSLDELVILNNALNEICYGIDMDDAEFSARIGVEHKEGIRLLNEISSLIDALDRQYQPDVRVETPLPQTQEVPPAFFQ